MRKYRWLIGSFVLALAAAPVAEAQSGLSLWLGGGRATNQTRLSLKNGHVSGAVQLGFPLLPVALRGEAILAGGKFDRGARSLLGSAVLPLKLPVVQPYGIAGYGTYGTGPDTEERGVHYGAGVRAGVSRLGIFFEVRRHHPIRQTLATVGITL